MQFSPLSVIALLATVAAAAPVVEEAQAMRSIEARETSTSRGGLAARQNANDLAALDVFSSSGCSNYQTTVFVFQPGGGSGPGNGRCFQLGQNGSVKTTFLKGSCTSTAATVRPPHVWAPASVATGGASRLTTACERVLLDDGPWKRLGKTAICGFFPGVSIKKGHGYLGKKKFSQEVE
ncbi:hypothetical protein PpBr36_05243 [Pyricularia pennisetigena]|uniref:hypothetical protein n=1 Tax=Pyricularia pennisetigena TaxID=1578925 RepID=UPI001150E3B5|nr:hypothetical protein PpBr36_05243 [Pyricularia pennisetigena]TLS26968.1 hypothetical protein PpBr36_05243 [Pyricularia pennisetigena]